MEIEITVLGPLRVRRGNRELDPGPARNRRLLALLAVHEGRMVPIETMVDELWGERPPTSSVPTVQSYIRRIRRNLDEPGQSGTGAGSAVMTYDGGYAVRADRVAVDLTHFRTLVAEADALLLAGDIGSAVATVRRALDLHPGPALGGLDPGPLLTVERRRLDEERLVLWEQCLDAELERGRHRQVCDELAELTARHPQRERLWALHLTALARCGRVREAIDVYDRVERDLDDRCGLVPSTALRTLRQTLTTA